jgi:hypothetical protein
MALQRRLVFALLIGFACAGCYKPSIKDGGLQCADGGICPEGYYCAGDGVCRKVDPQCVADAGPVVPLCTPEPTADCDPICQSHCQCGRCNLVGSDLKCVPAGDKKPGDICNRAKDDCAPGSTCVPDCKTIGRCYRFCGRGDAGADDLCGGGQPCNYNAPSGDLLICQPPVSKCDPVGNGNDCGHPELACYLSTKDAPVCDCRGEHGPTESCDTYNSCIPGYRCVQFGTGTGTRACYKTCLMTSASDCTAPATCKSLGGSSAYGYCAP